MKGERSLCVYAVVLLFVSWNVAALQRHMEVEDASLSSHLGSYSHIAVRRHIALALQKGADQAKELVAYRARYLSEMRSKQAVYFLHVSKSAGSFLCECASLSGCRNFERTNRSTCHDHWQCGNCHAPFNYPIWHYETQRYGDVVQRSSTLETCAGTAEYLRLHGVTVEGNERYLISESLCPQFWNVMVLRSPRDRLVSNLRMISVDYKGLLPINATLQDVNRKLPALANNFFIRNLLGKDVYELPFGQITEMHLEKAKQVLEAFDLVFVQGETLTQRVQSRMGWSCLSQRAMAGNTDEYMTFLQQLWTPADWEELHENNKFDELLVNHARMLEETDQAVFDHPVFASSSISHQYLCK